MNSSKLLGGHNRIIGRVARALPVVLKSTALAMLSTGCMSLVDARIGPDGKAGWIVKRYSADELRLHRPSCLATLPAEAIETNQFVEVSVSKGRGRRYVAAILPATLSADAGDRVEVAPYRCDQGRIPIVRQVLERHH